MKKTEIVILTFTTNVVINAIELNISASIGWLVATVYYILYINELEN